MDGAIFSSEFGLHHIQTAYILSVPHSWVSPFRFESRPPALFGRGPLTQGMPSIIQIFTNLSTVIG